MNDQMVNGAGLDRACPTRDELVAFVSGQVGEESSRQIAQHVGHCADCGLVLESCRLPFVPVQRAGEFDHEPEAQRMIAAAKAIFSHARLSHTSRPGSTADGSESEPAESVSTKTELDATECFSASVSQTRTYQPQTPDGLGRYEIEAALGAGTFGRVFRAYDIELDRLVAIKISNPGQESIFQQTLLDEARSAARLHHAGIVSIYDVGRSDDGATFVVMQYVDGQSLRDLLGRERPSFERTVKIVEQIAKAVHYAHKHGLVHRDLKPGNVLIDRGGEVRVADFGLALVEDQQRSRAGEFAGTPAYMSPEQVRGESHRLDGRADVWALGVILYEMLTGRRPFRGRRDELLDEIEHRAPKPPRQYDERIPIELERACLKCLEKQPERRYSTALDLVADLERWRVPPNRKKHRWPLAATAAVAASLIALAGGLKYLTKPAGVSGTSTLGAVSGPGLDIGSPESLGRWVPLLESPPRPLFKPTNALDRWQHDPLKRDVQVSSPGWYLMDLGETMLPSYELKMTIAKAAHAGEAGFFIGYQPSQSKFGRPAWKCQVIKLACLPNRKLSVRRQVLLIEDMGTSFGFSDGKRREEILNESNDRSELSTQAKVAATLTLSVAGGRVQSVRWNDRPLLQLSDHKAKATTRGEYRPELGMCKGRFGLANVGGTTVFSNVEFMPKSRSEK